MTRSIILIFILLLALLISCKKKEPRIYELEKLSEQKVTEQGIVILEIFIVANPPNDYDKLKCLIKSFNDSTMIQGLLGQSMIYRKREFYRETEDLNESFEEKDPNTSGYFEKVDLSGYYTYKIAESCWRKQNRFTGYYTWYLEDKSGITSHFSFDLP